MKKLRDSIEFLDNRVGLHPTVGIILGSGLGEIVEKVSDPIIINYREIPHFLNTGI